MGWKRRGGREVTSAPGDVVDGGERTLEVRAVSAVVGVHASLSAPVALIYSGPTSTRTCC